MPEIGTSGSMSGDGKRGVAEWPKLPRPSSTLHRVRCCGARECRLAGQLRKRLAFARSVEDVRAAFPPTAHTSGDGNAFRTRTVARLSGLFLRFDLNDEVNIVSDCP